MTTGWLLPAAILCGGVLAGSAGEEVTRFADPLIVESSGLVALGDTFLTANDSGDSGRVFVVDRATGRTVREVVWAADPIDVEALAPAANDAVWVGDIGDNSAKRDHVQLARVMLDGSAAQVYAVRYPGGPVDAETLLHHPGTGQLFVVTKSVFGGRVLAAPTTLTEAPASEQATILRDLGSVAGLATDGAFFPDGRHLVVRNYTRAFVYSFPTLDLVGAFDLPEQEQGEGLAIAGPDSLYLSSEGVAAPVLRVRLPAQVRAAMQSAISVPAPPEAPSAPPAEPTPDPGLPGSQWLLVAVGVTGAVLVALRLRRR